MTAVGVLVLVLGLLESARCDVRSRDPGVEEEEEQRGRTGGGGGGFFPSYLERLYPRATETPPQEEGEEDPIRSGNWCSFVQMRVVTTAVACGTEKYIIRSQNRCPSGTDNCQVILYKQSTRPIYKQTQKNVSSLLWRCCPGFGGDNCEDAVSDGQTDSGSSTLIGGSEKRTELHAPDIRLQQQHINPDREQNDSQMPAGVSDLYGTAGYHDNQRTNDTHSAPDPGPAHIPHHTSHHNADPHHHHLHPNQFQRHERRPPVVDEWNSAPLSHSEAPAPLPVPHMLVLVMSQLQPVLEGFNRSLEHLSQQVGDLARDVAQLKSARPQTPQPPERHELDDSADERLEARLDEVFEHIRELRRQMESQSRDVEHRLHSQHTMLHYNLTSFKTDIDMKLKRNQKMLQVSLQTMNTTLAELKMDLDQTGEDPLPLEDVLPAPHPLQNSDTSVLWEAVERLDNTVVNNTVKVDGLMEDMDVTSGDVQQLQRDLKRLEQLINQTARNSQVQFMETGLEVEAAREAVLRQVGELAGNLTAQGERLQEMDVDVDYLYTNLYNSSSDCNCKTLKAAMAQLERGVANVTELANKNRMSLDETNEGGAGQWGGASDWEPAVEALQHGLQQVKESLVSEQTRTSALDHSLRRLSVSVTESLSEVEGLKEEDGKLVKEMQHLSASFKALLKDAIRHSDVLEMLLGEEVLEFLEWPFQDQEAHSIPALKEQLGQLQEKVTEHNLSLTSLLGSRRDIEEVPSADQPSSAHLLPDDWLTRRSGSDAPARERQLLLHPDGRRPQHRGDGSDLWNLEKMVEELERKVLRLEEKHSNTSAEREAPPGGAEAKLQAEVMWLKRGLEEHLRVFKNVFSNADVLDRSDATLELDKVWQLVKNKEGRKEKKKGGGGGRQESGRGGNHRSRRESSGIVPSGLSEASLLLVAGSHLNVSSGVVAFKSLLTRGRFYEAGTFTAPVDGIYLFVLTLDMRPGPVHAVLRRGSGGATVSLQRQEVMEAGPITGVGLVPLSEEEEVRLELKGGECAESDDNVFTVLLLHRNT